MSRELKSWIRPRPLRIAFLLEDWEHAPLTLDGIFADCYSRWGGRFSLIVPCIDGRIAAAYWQWLEAYDPDIVYSYVKLSKTDILELHERLSPSQYMYHDLGREPRLDVYGFKPSYDFPPLSSLSTIFKQARYSPRTGEMASVSIIDCWHTEQPTRFLSDNFGTYHLSQGGGIYPPDAATAANLLTIVSPDKQADRRFCVPHDLNAIPNEISAFKEFAEKRATSLSLSSALFAPKLEIHAGRWSSSFNLVVGDSFADRILFWNGRLLIPSWLDNELCCFRVGLDQIRGAEFLTVLTDLLNRRNHVNGGSGGQSQITVRSASLSKVQLDEVQQILSSLRLWSSVAIESNPQLESIVPSAEALRTARESNRFSGGLFQQQPDWDQFVWSPPSAHPPVSAPDHLADAPVRQMFTLGYWATDFIFEHDGPGPRLADENRWMLPRRWRMAGAFKATFVGTQRHIPPPSTRRSRDGNLAIFVCTDHPVETISVPTAYEAMQYALAADGAWINPNDEHGRVYPPSKVGWTHPSNEARYLTGILGMTGGLRGARRLLLHPFLRDNFANLGGTPNLPVNQVMPTVNRLQKKYRTQDTFDLASDGERKALANLIVKASREIKSPMDYVTYDDLNKSWKAYREKYWAANPQHGGDTSVDWDKHEEESLEECLIQLRNRQMLYQGHQWTCAKCHHKNWVDLGALSPELNCEICKQPANAPVNIHWLFRPNEFLIESLRDHSVLSLVWVLSALCNRSRRSLTFVEPTWFGFNRDSDKHDAEADLLVLLDCVFR